MCWQDYENPRRVAKDFASGGQFFFVWPGSGEMMQDREWHERGLQAAVASGDERAWRVWYEAEYSPLEAFVLWRCGSLRDFADDVIQETWLTAVKRIQKFEPTNGPFRAWLRGIACNVLRNHLRSRRRRKAHESPVEHEVTCEDGTIPSRERAARIARALDGLPERYENVLRLKYVEQQSVASIAATIGETEKAIESLLTRARSAFREAYGDD